MEQSKLIRLFKSLTKAEIKSFGKFLEGNYRENGGVIILYDYLRKQSANWEEAKLNVEKVNKLVYKAIGKKAEKNPSHYKLLNDLKSKLYAELEDFLILEKLSRDYTQKGQLMLEIFREREVDRLFFNRAEQLKKQWVAKPPKGIDNLYQNFRLTKIVSNHEAIKNKPTAQINLMEDLDKFYLAQKLFWLNNFENNRDVKPDNGCIYMLDEILAVSDLPNFQAIPQIRLQRNIYHNLVEGGFSYDSVKNYFFKHIEEYDYDEKYDVYTLLLAICAKRELLDQFKLRRLGVDYNIIGGGSGMTLGVFKGTVNTACAVGELEWAQNFIDTYIDKIMPNERKATEVLCRSTLALYEKRIDWILENLGPMSFKDKRDKLFGRMLILQAYYEQDDKIAFNTYVPAVNQFLRSNKDFNQNILNRYIHFVRLVKKLFNLKKSVKRHQVNQTNLEDLIKFKEKLIETKGVPRKVWLLQKVEEELLFRN